jgi:hypothetical protein
MVCDKRIYSTKNLRKNLRVTEDIRREFYEFDKEVIIPEVLVTCCRCHDSLKKGKMPGTAICNNMKLAEIPDHIKCLTLAETGLIKQVKAFMKIYLLCSGRGQKGMKGMTVHFAQQVQEVATILPQCGDSSDIVIVKEHLDGVQEHREIRVCPIKVLAAIAWLIENNPLYRNVTLNHDYAFTGFQSVTLRDKVATEQEIVVDNSSEENIGYMCIGPGLFILRSSICQCNIIFQSNAGKQCTAMCASFLAHAFIDSPLTWTKSILDKVIVTGDQYYSIKKVAEHDFLNSDEVVGQMTVFDGFNINLEIDLDGLFQYQGYLKPAKGADTVRLEQIVQLLISSSKRFAILTTNNYSMAIHLDGDYVYFFDSHSRGKKGCRANNGRACVLKCETRLAPSRISYLVNRNCLPSNTPVPQLHNYAFTITPFSLSNTDHSPIEINPTNGPGPQNSRASFTDMQDDVSSSESSEDECEEENEIIQNRVTGFGKVQNFDCVIEDQDILEPELDEILNLKRKTSKPLNDFLEKNLDVLSFPNLFPDSKNGLNEFRKKNYHPS